MKQIGPNPRGPHLEAEKFCDIVLNIVDHLDAMVAYWDINQVCQFANSAYRDWFGKTRQEVIGLTMRELLGPLYFQNLPYIVAALEGQTQVFERDIPTPDGRVRHSLATYTPDIEDGQVRGMIAHVADVTRLKMMEQELLAAKAKAEQLATHDFLTGLPNRVLLLDRIAQAFALANRNHQMVAVLLMDVDDFKKVNDTYGHGEGDRLLVEIAARAKSLLRESDTLTRLGGDEFLLLAPAVESDEQIEAMADRILERMRLPFELGGVTLSPTFSLGIAFYPRDGTAPAALMASSDRALYAAKELGKNRYVIATQGDTPEPAA